MDKPLVTFDQVQAQVGDPADGNLQTGALVVGEDNVVRFVPDMTPEQVAAAEAKVAEQPTPPAEGSFAEGEETGTPVA